MPKKVLIPSLILLLGIVSFVYYQKKPVQSDSKETLSSTTSKAAQKDSTNPSVSQKAPYQKIKTSNEIAPFLKDTKNSPKERVYLIKDIALEQDTPEAIANAHQLVVFINEPNPYSADPEAHEHDSYKGHLMQKEASLKVYSIKRLSQALPYGRLEPLLNDIIKNNQDKALVRIAEQVLEAKRNGKDYFEKVKRGVLSMDPKIKD